MHLDDFGQIVLLCLLICHLVRPINDELKDTVKLFAQSHPKKGQP